MPQSAPQSDPQHSLQGLIQAGQDLVQQFERALFGGNVIAPSDIQWPAATPTSVTDLFDLQRRYFEQMGQLWGSFLTPPGAERKPVAAPAKGDDRFRRGAGDLGELVARLGPLAQGTLDRHDSGSDQARQQGLRANRAGAWALRQDQNRLSRNVGQATDRRKP
jgi:hypothetical protein